MSNDQSFNDSDELISLYSSKKITDTFKAQLKKIAVSNHHINNSLPHENIKVSSYNKNKDQLNAKFEAFPVFNHANEKPQIDKPSEILQVDLSDSPTDNSLDDAVEVISDFTPSRCNRRSERLRMKRRKSVELESWTGNSNSLVSNKKTRNKKGRKGKQSQKGKVIDEVTLEDSPEPTENEDELNPVMSVKVIWKSVNVKKFQIRKFQKLSYIFELLSKEEDIPEEKIILTFNNVRVNQSDTPDLLNLQVYDFLDGGILTELTNSCQIFNSQKTESDSDSVTLKFQDVNKHMVKLNLNKHEKVKVAMIKCSEQLEVPLKNIKFFFDGESLNPSETPASLGLENDEVIDIKICS